MKQILLGTIALFALVMALPSCDPLSIRGNGNILEEVREPGEFHAVQVSTSGKVKIVHGDVWKVNVSIEETLVPYLETEVRNGRLDIYFSRSVWDVDNLEITVTTPELDAIELSGSADIVALDSLSGNALDLDISGSGTIKVNQLAFQDVKTAISGSGDITIAGAADHLDAAISGSGDIYALDCPVKTADVAISGSGNVRCDVSEYLKAVISGSGDVLYEGDPQVESHISGTGKVRKL